MPVTDNDASFDGYIKGLNAHNEIFHSIHRKISV